jgi:CRISPR-associated exonuclease Cas4
MLVLLIIAVIILGVGLFLWTMGRRTRVATGLPTGEIVYSDVGVWQEVERPLISRRYGLIGRPDYLVEVSEASRRMSIPVEVKSRKRPSSPYDSHILQLGTYCLLVEDVLKVRPPYGLLRYADATIRIPYTEDLRQQVLRAAGEIRQARRAGFVARQHEDPRRCRGCGYRLACGAEALE